MPVRSCDYFPSSCAELQVDIKQLTLLFTQLYNALLPTVFCHSIHVSLQVMTFMGDIALQHRQKHFYKSKTLTMISTTFRLQKGQANLHCQD